MRRDLHGIKKADPCLRSALKYYNAVCLCLVYYRIFILAMLHELKTASGNMISTIRIHQT